MRERRSDPVAVFGIGPAEAALHATVLGYCFSIQAMWEKQIRGYLESCAREPKAESRTTTNIRKAEWKHLDRLFQELRGVSLSAFAEYTDLHKLHLLANACRHGNGRSLDLLVSVSS
jgi:hypothetical protein